LSVWPVRDVARLVAMGRVERGMARLVGLAGLAEARRVGVGPARKARDRGLSVRHGMVCWRLGVSAVAGPGSACRPGSGRPWVADRFPDPCSHPIEREQLELPIRPGPVGADPDLLGDLPDPAPLGPGQEIVEDLHLEGDPRLDDVVHHVDG
jgi:hypothetical protein